MCVCARAWDLCVYNIVFFGECECVCLCLFVCVCVCTRALIDYGCVNISVWHHNHARVTEVRKYIITASCCVDRLRGGGTLQKYESTYVKIFLLGILTTVQYSRCICTYVDTLLLKVMFITVECSSRF